MNISLNVLGIFNEVEPITILNGVRWEGLGMAGCRVRYRLRVVESDYRASLMSKYPLEGPPA